MTVLVLGLLLNAVALPLAIRRVVFLYRLISSGQPAPDRLENVTKRTGKAISSQLVEVLGQRRLLKWTVPGAAHASVMYAFLILASVYLEAYIALLTRDPSTSFLIFNSWGPLGFLQDLIGVLCLVGLVVFTVIRYREAPARLGRASRFKGSHTGGAWLVLFMIFNVIWTMFLFRGASSALGNLGYGKWAFASYAVGKALGGPTEAHGVEVLEGIGLLLHIGIMLVFLIIVLNSKHLHIFVAPLNVMFKRPDGPVALGALKPLTSDGKALTLDDVEDMDEDTKLGIGAIEDFTWKGMLDFASCTECGRCQSQCPAWNTEKPLSPKMLIMNLRDHAFAKAPYLLADSDEKRDDIDAAVMAEVERALVGPTEGEAWHPTGGAVIDPDVLWSCVTCGACVNQCPVDIEHVDHIVDMRRYQVLIESSFPSELNGLFKGMESKGNPWNMSPSLRLDWAQGLDVKVVGEDVEDLDEVDWLFWIGCAGAYEDRAKKTVRAVAELLDLADVSFAVLGKGETCTGDSARRAGNEFLFQQLATQNVEVLTEAKAKKVVSTCPHCFNTLKNEYSELGIELEVVHHTQLLNRLVREGRLTPVADNAGPKQTVTYHDPCYLGRHNQVYTPPRELLEVIPSTDFKEMERSGERSFCCGAGGARMWMEERIGERINENRTKEAVGTGADQIAVGCPFCRVMLSDGLTMLQSKEEAREEVEVLDVAQMLLAAVKRGETPAETKTEPADRAGDAEHYPATIAHDGTEDPEQAPDRTGDAPEVTDPTGSVDGVAVEAAGSGETASAASAASASLPAWAGLDVETILEGDDVDISEFKAKLKAELKDELLAEIKAELEGALNSESGTSEPVEKTTSPSVADKPSQTEQSEAAPAPDPEPAPAAEPEAKPTTAEEKVEEKPAEKKPAASSEPPPDIDFSGSL